MEIEQAVEKNHILANFCLSVGSSLFGASILTGFIELLNHAVKKRKISNYRENVINRIMVIIVDNYLLLKDLFIAPPINAILN